MSQKLFGPCEIANNLKEGSVGRKNMSKQGQVSCVLAWLVAILVIAPGNTRADDGTWVTVGAAGFSAGGVTISSVAFQPSSNQPYVAYQDQENGSKVTVMRFDGANWVKVGAAGFSEGWVSHLYTCLRACYQPAVRRLRWRRHAWSQSHRQTL